MFTLLLLLLGLAALAAQVLSASHRPVPVTEALPVAGLGLAWRRKKSLTTKHGPRTLWMGDGDAALYRRAYDLARGPMRDAGYSWTEESREGGVVSLRPCCWEPVPADDAVTQAALDAAAAAIAADDARIERVEDMRREARENAARLVADDSRAALAALRESLDVLFWAWPKRKEAIARELLREPMECDGDVPKPAIADLARKLTRQVNEAVAAVRARVATDASHDWLERARDPEVRRAVHAATQILCEMDQDRASVRNGYGWGKSHSHAGHVLGSLRELSVIEASQALCAVYRHRKQLRPEIRQACFGSAEA